MAKQNTRWKRQDAAQRGIEERHVGELMTALAYAFDQLIIFKGTSARRIEEKWSWISQASKEWERNNNTRYNIAKTKDIFAEKENKQIRAPVVRLDDNQIVSVAQLKFVQLMRKSYGTEGLFVRAVIERAVKLAVLYACEIWGERARTTVNRKIMMATYRPLLLAAVKT